MKCALETQTIISFYNGMIVRELDSELLASFNVAYSYNSKYMYYL